MHKATLLDALERVLVLGFYGYLTARAIQHLMHAPDPIVILLLFSEGFVVLFLLMRKRAQSLSTRPRDWWLAMAGTVAPLLVQTEGTAPLVPSVLSAVIMIIGLCLQISAKMFLGRKFGVVPANRGITVRGPYRVLRHPMYAGYILTHIGFFLGSASLWNAAIYIAEAGFQIARMKAEEELLAQDPDYRAFAGKVRYRFIPGVY